MTLRPCGRPGCRLCNPRPLPERRDEPLAELALGAAAFVALIVFLFVLLPVLAS